MHKSREIRVADIIVGRGAASLLRIVWCSDKWPMDAHVNNPVWGADRVFLVLLLDELPTFQFVGRIKVAPKNSARVKYVFGYSPL